jgi:hypothetical protein
MSSIDGVGPVLDVAPEAWGTTSKVPVVVVVGRAAVGRPDMTIQEDGSDVGS